MILRATRLSATGNNARVQNLQVRTINFVGDSITDNYNVNVSATDRRKASESYVQWALSRMQYRADAMWNPTGNSSSAGGPVVGTYEFATFGAPCSLIQTNHLPEVNANRADLVSILAGANNLGNGNETSAQVFAAIQSLVANFRAAGHNNIVICALTPRSSALNTLGSDGKTFAVRVQETNALLAPWCVSQGIGFCDWTSVITDANGFWLTNFSGDGVHPSTRGAQAMGQFYADFLMANYNLGSPILNSQFLSTLNSQSSPTSGYSLFTFNIGAPASATQTTVAGTDGFGDWRRVTTTHSDPAINYTNFTRTGMTLNPEWNIQNGDMIQGVFEARLISGVSNSQITAEISGNGRFDRFFSNSGGGRRIFSPFEGVFLGQPFVVNSNTTINATISIVGSMQIDFRRVGFRRVTSMVPPYV